jgi:hypothetical protein
MGNGSTMGGGTASDRNGLWDGGAMDGTIGGVQLPVDVCVCVDLGTG